MNDKIIDEVRGLKIGQVWIDEEYNYGDSALCLSLQHGKVLFVWDDGRNCCEQRYLTCDDDFDAFIGATLLDIGVRDGPTTDEDSYGDVHETQFVHIVTDKGTIVVTTHNEHNGYYGGFSLRMRVADKVEDVDHAY